MMAIGFSAFDVALEARAAEIVNREGRRRGSGPMAESRRLSGSVARLSCARPSGWICGAGGCVGTQGPGGRGDSSSGVP